MKGSQSWLDKNYMTNLCFHMHTHKLTLHYPLIETPGFCELNVFVDESKGQL